MRQNIEKFFCDRCGNEMEKPKSIDIDGMKDGCKSIQRLRSEWEYIDLCPKCKDSFVRWWLMGKEK